MATAAASPERLFTQASVRFDMWVLPVARLLEMAGPPRDHQALREACRACLLVSSTAVLTGQVSLGTGSNPRLSAGKGAGEMAAGHAGHICQLQPRIPSKQ